MSAKTNVQRCWRSSSRPSGDPRRYGPAVTCATVACPSGQRSTPRKRVWVRPPWVRIPPPPPRSPLFHKGLRHSVTSLSFGQMPRSCSHRWLPPASKLATTDPRTGLEAAKFGPSSIEVTRFAGVCVERTLRSNTVGAGAYDSSRVRLPAATQVGLLRAMRLGSPAGTAVTWPTALFRVYRPTVNSSKASTAPGARAGSGPSVRSANTGPGGPAAHAHGVQRHRQLSHR